MTEREMLEAAARAMGLQQTGWLDGHEPMQAVLVADGDYQRLWNPLNDGAQALDLAAALRISVEHNHPADNHPWVCASVDGYVGRGQQFVEDVPDESQRADRMRLAILRCAAAQALAMGAETAENGSKAAGNGVDAGFHRGRGVAPKEQA